MPLISPLMLHGYTVCDDKDDDEGDDDNDEGDDDETVTCTACHYQSVPVL